MLEEEGVLQTDPEKTIMQKYLLYRKGLQIADIDQNDVKRDAKLALSDWIECSRLLFDETEGSEALTFRFVEMRGYKEGYEGTCYWISLRAHRPYVKKEGYFPNKTSFDLWVYWDQDRWNALPFNKSTLDDAILILMESWKREMKPHLIPALKEKEKNWGTTTDDIYVDVLQRLQKARVRLEATLTYEEAEHIEEDEDGKMVYVPTGEPQVWFMIEDEIKLYEGNKIVLPNSAFDIEDLEEVGFGIEEHHPSPLDMSLSFEERIEQTTDLETLCALINELADMGCEVFIKENEKNDSPQVLVLDVEYIKNKDGFDNLTRILSRGKYKIHYLSLLNEGGGALNSDEIKTAELPTYMSFWVWYNREAVRYRVNHGDEDARTYYRTNFLLKVQAARANGEIPSVLF